MLPAFHRTRRTVTQKDGCRGGSPSTPTSTATPRRPPALAARTPATPGTPRRGRSARSVRASATRAGSTPPPRSQVTVRRRGCTGSTKGSTPTCRRMPWFNGNRRECLGQDSRLGPHRGVSAGATGRYDQCIAPPQQRPQQRAGGERDEDGPVALGKDAALLVGYAPGTSAEASANPLHPQSTVRRIGRVNRLR